MCVCVCVRERESESASERASERAREGGREGSREGEKKQAGSREVLAIQKSTESAHRSFQSLIPRNEHGKD